MKKSVPKRASYSPVVSGQAVPSAGAWITQSGKAPSYEAPTCDRCASDDFLVYENVTLLLDSQRVQPPCWDVEFWCGRCESYGGTLTTHVPDDRQAVRLASENPRYVNYRVAPQEAAIGTKVARGDRRRLAGAGQLPIDGGSAPANDGNPVWPPHRATDSPE
ncbi:hypothetical protein KRR55_11550 [Paeniglutamicibacter sp. ABSL32-1]|uniref:hypothetical protein n=1 Tax=Paeniglutamicibacter quisquiliarum TaxID=2849498 RepID=UPI001C2D509A|nr:hypothetical protein [Paeniglutamicibacter quisquiliarum]MBV1779746.1 hypothetical protein [Paeniglutamicibacter quisquiliarum]